MTTIATDRDWAALAAQHGPLPAPYCDGRTHQCDACAARRKASPDKRDRRGMRTHYPIVYTDVGEVVRERHRDAAGFTVWRARPYQRCPRCFAEHEAARRSGEAGGEACDAE